MTRTARWTAGVLAVGAATQAWAQTPPAAGPTTRPAGEPRLSVQTSAPWQPRLNVDADVAMVYGVTKSTAARMTSWRDRGYTIDLMTGVAWGEYQDYLFGRFDGKQHIDEAQTNSRGERRAHGKDIYYMSPGPTYGAYLSSLVKQAIDDGAGAIYLEEPEFWVSSGYEPHFKLEWQQYYHEPWQDPESSPEAQYRSSQLKYFLYRRALADVFHFVRDYSKTVGRDVKCYVATHSLINYANWGIVSPESSLIDVGCDGYIAQVWTGTSRSENTLDGVRRERTFETAFLEYGQMQNLVRASGREMWFLNDPVEDNPRHTWEDYRTNWECTLTASLLQPQVWKFETMPWPERVFNSIDYSDPEHGKPIRRKRKSIPPDYAVELQAVVHALGDMHQAAVKWDRRGTAGVGVLVSDTLMFERGGPDHSDADLGNFFGLSLPLVNAGVPAEPVQLEDAPRPHFLGNYKLLLLTYHGQKPMTPAPNAALADWVKAGGALVVVDDDSDPFNNVREWWNTNGRHDATPRLDLFHQLGLPDHPDGVQHVGRGVVLLVPKSPGALSHDPAGGQVVLDACASAAKTAGLDWQTSPGFVLRRGPYVIAAALPDAAAPVTFNGRFIPLFDPAMPTVTTVTLKPNERSLLVDLDAVPKPSVAAASCRVGNPSVTAGTLTFDCTGVDGTTAVVRVACDGQPKSVEVNGKPAEGTTYADGVLRLSFPNSVDPVHISARF